MYNISTLLYTTVYIMPYTF